MNIKGLQKTSLLDYPGEICSAVFVGGCNLRCRYCHNKDLVLDSAALPAWSVAGLLAFLKGRMPLVDAVCISGGEPTLQPDLVSFLSELRKLGLKVKLDTNGTRPGVVRRLLREGLLDYIAMDLKCPFEKYPYITGATRGDVEKIKQTVDLLLRGDLNCEFRTTVVPTLLDEKDISKIAREIAGCRRYFLQQFSPGSGLLDPSLSSVQPFSSEKMGQMAASCSPLVDKVGLRGC